MEKVSIIIPTYNRFNFLLKAIESAKNQTYPNKEIIIVNDCSTQKEYYNHKFEGCIVINMEKNSKSRFGHASPGGFQRSIGMKIATGKYFAFLDDDDYWLPNKLEKQINAMETTQCKMSCTDGFIGRGFYNPEKKYKKYNEEQYKSVVINIFKRKNKFNLIKNGYPSIWNKEFMSVHNCCIASSVVIHRNIWEKIGSFSNQLWAPDYEYWQRAIQHTECIYLNEPLLYWDAGHGDGQNY